MPGMIFMAFHRTLDNKTHLDNISIIYKSIPNNKTLALFTPNNFMILQYIIIAILLLAYSM